MKLIRLKNADHDVKMDEHVFDWLVSDDQLVKVDFVHNLRLHSSGCAVFQKTRKVSRGKYATHTIYLHKHIAEKYLNDQCEGQKNLVGAVNGDKLDCQLVNLVYRTRSVASRKRKTSNKVGFTGVYQENNRFRSVISIDGRSHHLGMFSTAELAAAAYNRKSWDVFGDEGKLNQLGSLDWKPKADVVPAKTFMPE